MRHSRVDRESCWDRAACLVKAPDVAAFQPGPHGNAALGEAGDTQFAARVVQQARPPQEYACTSSKGAMRPRWIERLRLGRALTTMAACCVPLVRSRASLKA